MPTSSSAGCHSRSEYERLARPPTGVPVGITCRPLGERELEYMELEQLRADGCFGPVNTTAVAVAHVPKRKLLKQKRGIQRLRRQMERLQVDIAELERESHCRKASTEAAAIAAAATAAARVSGQNPCKLPSLRRMRSKVKDAVDPGKSGVSVAFDSFLEQHQRQRPSPHKRPNQRTKRKRQLAPLDGRSHPRCLDTTSKLDGSKAEQLRLRELDAGNNRAYAQALGGLAEQIVAERHAAGHRTVRLHQPARLQQNALEASSFGRAHSSYFALDRTRAAPPNSITVQGKANQYAHQVWLQSVRAEQVDAERARAEYLARTKEDRLNAQAQREGLTTLKPLPQAP